MIILLMFVYYLGSLFLEFRILDFYISCAFIYLLTILIYTFIQIMKEREKVILTVCVCTNRILSITVFYYCFYTFFRFYLLNNK